jgi:uncharacterized protein YndB with AHSA1/START domain
VTAKPDTADREILTTRLLDAPPDLVFRMFKDPHHISRWWGPRGFTTTTFSKDFRPGGVWRFVMHGPDGTDYHNQVTYKEIVDAQRITYLHQGCGDHNHVRFDVTITFDPAGPNRTRLTFHMVFASREDRDSKQGAVEGLKMTLDRLAEQLPIRQSGHLPFHISRTFDAPRDLVWNAWTERNQLMKWFGPKGFTMPAATLDLRPNGTFHFHLRSPAGQEMWAKWFFRDIIPPHRITYVSCFSDPEGNVARPPFPDPWPVEMLTTISFAEHEGKTTVTIQTETLNPTEAERHTFHSNFHSMTAGWTGTLDQLATHLAKP